MNPVWLSLIVPASAYVGFFISNCLWVAHLKRKANQQPKPNPYRN